MLEEQSTENERCDNITRTCDFVAPSRSTLIVHENSHDVACNQHQHRDRWAAGGTQLAAGLPLRKFCGLSRPSGSETTPPPPPRGRFCPSKLWASRHTRQTELPPPSPRDQWSLGKRARREREGAKQAQKNEQQSPREQLLGRCNSGAPSRHSIRESHSVCNTR